MCTTIILLNIVGGSEKSEGILEHKITSTTGLGVQSAKEWETKNLQMTVLASKVVNPFTRALEPPFIGRQRYFYILKIPSNLGNIASVNLYMNVFYIT
jgi:hypothetical protein